MTRPLRAPRIAVFALLGCALLVHAAGRAEEARPDPIADEIARLEAELAVDRPDEPQWGDLRTSATQVLADARQALGAGRRLVALERVLQARTNVAASAYVRSRPAEDKTTMAGLEAEWRRMRDVLPVATPSASSLAATKPALARGIGEAVLAQVGVYYDASLDYGRNTDPATGLQYIGIAQAQQQAAELVRSVLSPSPLPPPPVRSIAGEIDALQAELMAAYVPPAAIDRHPEFIVTSAALKEAQELDAAGLHHGALLRYTQAAQRTAMLRGIGAELALESVEQLLAEHEARLATSATDPSIGRLFVERARNELAKATPAGSSAAAAIAASALPRYFEALGPARPRPTPPAPRVTVTLVRWPYT